MTGTRVVCTKRQLRPFPRSWFICRTASRKGMDSMSPTVPPSSTMHTSAPVASATLMMCALISFVTCGMICTVFPRYSPILSFSITDL